MGRGWKEREVEGGEGAVGRKGKRGSAGCQEARAPRGGFRGMVERRRGKLRSAAVERQRTFALSFSACHLPC